MESGGEDDDFVFVSVLDMKHEGGGKNNRKVKVLIEFETSKEWVNLEPAMEDWPEEVKAFKQKWDKERHDAEEEKKKSKKRKSIDVFSCDLDHENVSLSLEPSHWSYPHH